MSIGIHIIAVLQNIFGWSSLKSDIHSYIGPLESQLKFFSNHLFSGLNMLNGNSAIIEAGKAQNSMKYFIRVFGLLCVSSEALFISPIYKDTKRGVG